MQLNGAGKLTLTCVYQKTLTLSLVVFPLSHQPRTTLGGWHRYCHRGVGGGGGGIGTATGGWGGGGGGHRYCHRGVGGGGGGIGTATGGWGGGGGWGEQHSRVVFELLFP